MAAPSLNTEEIFHQALSLPAGEKRNQYVQQACGSDAAQREHVLALLAAHEATGSPLDFTEGQHTIDFHVPAHERPGSIIGRYKLLEQIGEGGFGVVYMAEQETPIRRRVALKVIKLGMDTRHVVARFEAERQALAMMDHPNIAKVLDAGSTDSGRPYFVMELVRGVPITTYCDNQQLTTEQRLDLFSQVCSAVQHAHQKGVIHRDIKPSNVLVTMHDDKPVPKVIDFGIAKATQARLTEKTLFTEFRQIVGTPAYMSPEQAQFSGLDIDTRSDIYSLGVLLYELLTGCTPFDSRDLLDASYEEIRRIIREVEPPRPSTRLSALTAEALTSAASHRKCDPKRLQHLLRGDLDCIIMKCLEKNRTRRYETANGLAEDIGHFLKSEPVTARPQSVFYLVWKFARRNKGPLAAAAVVTLTLFLAVLISTGTALFAALAVAIALFAGFVVSTSQALRATRAQREQRRLRVDAEKAREQAEAAQAMEAKLREQAQRRFGEVQKLARVLMFDLYDKVSNLQGATDAIHLMARTAREYLETLSPMLATTRRSSGTWRRRTSAWGISKAILGNAPALRMLLQRLRVTGNAWPYESSLSPTRRQMPTICVASPRAPLPSRNSFFRPVTPPKPSPTTPAP